MYITEQLAVFFLHIYCSCMKKWLFSAFSDLKYVLGDKSSELKNIPSMSRMLENIAGSPETTGIACKVPPEKEGNGGSSTLWSAILSAAMEIRLIHRDVLDGVLKKYIFYDGENCSFKPGPALDCMVP